MYELLIQNGSTVYLPPVQEEVKVTTERQISPGSIEFSFVDTGISIAEGNPVRFKDGETGVFYGFIFKIKRDRSNIVKVWRNMQEIFFWQGLIIRRRIKSISA